jgi:hypothetical protein
MAGYGDTPFGLREIKVTNAAGSLQQDLPVAQTLKFGERFKTGELSGGDKLAAVASISEAVEWELGAGGISLEAYALMTGRTPVQSGSTPNRSYTLTGRAQQNMPWFKIYGKAMGAAADDIHCKLPKCKLTSIEGTFGEGEFLVTSAKGLAVDDGTSMFIFVQNETATTLPTT